MYTFQVSYIFLTIFLLISLIYYMYTTSQLIAWNEKCANESETANWILLHTKKCPKCTSRIEKNQGCNHMHCKVK
jgi:hypothetical protein